MSILLWQIEATARNFGEQVVKDWLYAEVLAGRLVRPPTARKVNLIVGPNGLYYEEV
jgi:hypothetical protein